MNLSYVNTAGTPARVKGVFCGLLVMLGPDATESCEL